MVTVEVGLKDYIFKGVHRKTAHYSENLMVLNISGGVQV